jgi:LCP family protein required for cell wall assembly
MSQGPGLSPTVDEPRRDWRRVVRLTLLGLVVIIVGFFGWAGLRLWDAWRSLERIDFAIEEARAALPLPSLAPEEAGLPVWNPPDTAFTSYLLIGSDERRTKAVAAADSIILFLDAGDAALLLSLPRDLLVTSPCNGELARLGSALTGCAGFGGAEVVALAVEGYTGIEVDHLAIFTFEGFEQIVDDFGGIELCVEYPFRYSTDITPLLLDAGCQVVDGYTALGWVSTRTPAEFINGEWVPDTEGDAGRRRRQQQFLLAVLDELRDFGSVNEVVDLAGDLASNFVVDDNLSVFEAISRAWDLRGVSSSSIVRVEIEVTPGATEGGQFALTPVRPFAEELVAVYPPASAFYS